MDQVTRRGFLRESSFVAALAPAAPLATAQQPAAAESFQHRTQFDTDLLPGSQTEDQMVASNQGRQVLLSAAGDVMTALSWSGDTPRVRLWRNRESVAEHLLPGPPSAPFLLPAGTGAPVLWVSAGDTVYAANPATGRLAAISGVSGSILDAAAGPGGRTLLALSQGGQLSLAAVLMNNIEHTVVDQETGRASLEFDDSRTLHLAYEKHHGIEYRRYDGKRSFQNARPLEVERAADAFGFHPVLLAHGGQLLLAYLGESYRLPSARPGSPAWQRLGRGGYIALLTKKNGRWRRHRLADSRQIVKPLYPIDGAYFGGDTRELPVEYEEFSAPALCVGPDGVVQVLWADTKRRWIYGARLLGEEPAAALELRGPLEQLTGPCLMPRRVARGFRGLPIAMVTRSRTYLDRIALPETAVRNSRRIDFVNADELAEWRGLEAQANQMVRHPENPVIPIDKEGAYAAVLADTTRDGQGWRAELMYLTDRTPGPDSPDRAWKCGGRAVSSDGIHWKKLDPIPLEQRYSVDGVIKHRFAIRFVEDPKEKNPAWRFKGLWRSEDHGLWGWVAVTSPDAVKWSKVTGEKNVVRADDDARIWIDYDDIQERHFKVNAIGRSHSGRISVQYTSPDGMHWNDERETLDFKDPFHARPERGTTGRILLDSWAGPDDEDEIHGGYVFHDAGRWLLHYMKWTGDGHLYCGLASSRDGVNFSRVCGGATTLPLGEAGAWDGGRIALREAPFRVGEVWRQYYGGCGWKHGQSGAGAKASHIGVYAPIQMGLAEIPAGHWVHLQVARAADFGELTVIELRLERPHDLTVDVEGSATPGASLACGIVDPQKQVFLPGFSYQEFDPVQRDGRNVPVAWRGRSLRSLGARSIQLRVRLGGHRAKLYGLNLV